jgi:hypothetical protein
MSGPSCADRRTYFYDELLYCATTACYRFAESAGGRSILIAPSARKLAAPGLGTRADTRLPRSRLPTARVTPAALLYRRPPRHIAVQQSQHRVFSAITRSSPDHEAPCRSRSARPDRPGLRPRRPARTRAPFRRPCQVTVVRLRSAHPARAPRRLAGQDPAPGVRLHFAGRGMRLLAASS